MTPITRLNTNCRVSQVPTVRPEISTPTQVFQRFSLKVRFETLAQTSLSVLRTHYMWQWQSTFSHTGGLTEALNTGETLDSLPPSVSCPLFSTLSHFSVHKNAKDVHNYCLFVLLLFSLTLKNICAWQWLFFLKMFFALYCLDKPFLFFAKNLQHRYIVVKVFRTSAKCWSESKALIRLKVLNVAVASAKPRRCLLCLFSHISFPSGHTPFQGQPFSLNCPLNCFI